MWRKKLLLGLTALAGGTLGASVYYLRDPIVERWYLWKFDHGTEAQKIDAIKCLCYRRSSKAIPFSLRFMEETDIRRGMGREMAKRVYFERRDWLEWATFMEARSSREWIPERFMKAFRKILPEWNGDFDEEGVRDFYRRLEELTFPMKPRPSAADLVPEGRGISADRE